MTGEYNRGGEGPIETLESQFKVVLDDVMAHADSSIVTHENGVFINPLLEEHFPQARVFTDALANYIVTSSHDHVAQLAAYQAFHFAYTLSSLVLLQPPSISFKRFESGEGTVLTELDRDIIDYKADNPTLEILINRCMPELDSTGEYGNLVSYIALTTFMIIEEGEEAKAFDAIESKVKDFEKVLNEWDGNIGVFEAPAE